MPENSEHKPPETTKGDVIHAAVKTGLSTLPVIGGPAAELFVALVTPPLERRRQEWMEEIGAALRRLEETKGLAFENLRENEQFLDIALHATQAALRTSLTTKRQALRNTILNSALPGAPDSAMQQVFVNLIDDMTEWHIHILHLFHDPPHWFDTHGKPAPGFGMGSLSAVLETAFPELKGHRGFYDQVWQDLNSRGLINTGSLQTMMTGGGLMQRRSTEMGALFLRFISDPAE